MEWIFPSYFPQSHHFFKFEHILIQHSAVLNGIYKTVTVYHFSRTVELNVGDDCFCRFKPRKTFQYPLPLILIPRIECTPRNAIHYGNSQPRSPYRSSLDLTCCGLSLGFFVDSSLVRCWVQYGLVAGGRLNVTVGKCMYAF